MGLARGGDVHEGDRCLVVAEVAVGAVIGRGGLQNLDTLDAAIPGKKEREGFILRASSLNDITLL